MSNRRQDTPDELGAGPSRPTSNGLAREHVSGIQRARILTAITEEVAERGAANVTVAHVVAGSGVSRRTFYELFEDREDCLLAAFDEAMRRVGAIVIPAYECHDSWRSKTRAALTALLECLDNDPDAGRLLVVETLGGGTRVQMRRQRVLAQIIAIVDEGRTEDAGGEGPPLLTAEGIVGGVLAVLHSRLLACPGTGEDVGSSLLALTGPLMSMIVLPYLGTASAREELRRPVPKRRDHPHVGSANTLRDMRMRLTYRTVRVLMAVAEHPGSSNRQVGAAAGMRDQGQISKLLSRLDRLGLIRNTGVGLGKGTPNAWMLTAKGQEIEGAIGSRPAVEGVVRNMHGSSSDWLGLHA